jgi:hypothetical protein
MIKFGRVGKIELFGLKKQSIPFWHFQNRIKEEAKHDDLKIQLCLKHEKRKKNINESIYVLMTKFDILRKPECPIC